MSEVLEFKCPNCGGALQFDSDVQELKCEFCDSELSVDAVKDYNELLNNQKEDSTEWEKEPKAQWAGDEAESLDVYLCNSCGGEIIADENTSATSCPFCGNPVVLSGRLSGCFKPDYVIPFKLDKNAAKNRLFEHFKGKRLLPKVFKSQAKIDEIKGVYVPFWLFNTGVEADIRYRATRVRHWMDRDYNYTETQYYSVFRAGKVAFERVPVDGSSKMPNDLMESLEPYDFSEAVDFNTAYLAGFFADKYDVDAENSKSRANQRIKQSTEDAFRNTVIGFTSVMTEHSSVRNFNGNVKYALYPVWLLNTTWNGQKYTFAMNGQTGKFVGNLPMDKAAFWKWFGLIALTVTAGVFLLLFLIGKAGGFL